MKYDDTDIAQGYDSARHLPAGTLRLWLDAMARHVQPGDIRTIVDVGCGTGRFSAALADAFNADVIGVDPSLTMLAKARSRVSHPRIDFREGDAGHLPVADASACLIYLSMVYHHLGNPGGAAREFTRALRAPGFLCIRNATRDLLDRFSYLKYFPPAVEFNRRRLPSQRDVIETMRAHGFALLRHDVIEQPFADSFGDYYAKIRQRGLSDLAVLPDEEFEAGLQQMRQALASSQESGPVLEPIDLFVCAKTAEPGTAADAAHNRRAPLD
jgi:ubiquinone/menaquinone biosynthesis C-methylase UbiE